MTRCQRCGGNVFPEWRDDPKCLQCGRSTTPLRPPEPVASERYSSVTWFVQRELKAMGRERVPA